MNVDEALLTRYMESFVGFGSYAAPFWFIGAEQGGGRDAQELVRRLDAWRTLGKGEVIDLARYCELFGEARWHGPRARIQPTLGRLIRVVLAAEGQTASTELVRKYQAEQFGRTGGRTLVAELFPLPSQSVKRWIYGDLSSNPFLRNRSVYQDHLRPLRTTLLRARIDRHAPQAVVLLGWSNKAEWELLVGAPLEAQPEPSPGIFVGQRGKTICIVCRHPVSVGVGNEYFAQIGRLLAARAQSTRALDRRHPHR